MNKDLIYSVPQQQVSDFQFDHNVVDVFPDMIQRSVPGYSTIIDSIGQLAQRFCLENSNIYDLGCSLGAATLSMRRYIDRQNVSIKAVDYSDAMVKRCETILASYKSDIPVTVTQQDISETNIENASVVVLNFTLQFLPLEKRNDVLKNIYDGLLPGGILILSEKVALTGDKTDNALIELHHEFKRRNGYSELEISQKRTALENVMKLETMDTHLKRLKSLGFTEVHTWFQCFNFCSMLSMKHEGSEETND